MPARDDSTLNTLHTILQAAGDLVDEITVDGVVARLLRSFTLMPPEDRETVAGVLEREVSVRCVTRASSDMSGWETRPNPNARLYVSAFGPQGVQRLPGMNEDDMTIALFRLSRVVPLLRGDELLGRWRAAARQAVGMLDPHQRAAVVEYGREMAAIAEEAIAA
ncbi:MAG: hypothetical protein ACREQL_14665 [Candidatus Binatia bacterium]